jgi:hypothetical protein
MKTLIENMIVRMWNRMATGNRVAEHSGSLALGYAIVDGQTTHSQTGIPQIKRTEHLALLGKTGTGKSTLLRYLANQDIEAGWGFCFFDLHGDATPILLQLIASEERRSNTDFSEKLIVIEPADLEFSVGLNVFEQRNTQQSFVQIAEFAAILKQRWHLDSFGARTEELLRNSLFALSESNQTLLELAPLLTNHTFRTLCLRRSTNSEVKGYFESRYDRASEGMQTVLRDAILNKVSAFTADPHFRHILGQQQSTFSLVDAIDRGRWVLLNLDKGRLGEQASTLGSLFLTKLKNALFSRSNKRIFTLYCDEIQNLVNFDSGLDTLLSEARKFSISITSANQFLDQYPTQMRSAIMAVGTHILFQLSSTDAEKMAQALDGGKTLAEILKNLPQRHMVIKSGHYRWHRAVVPRLDLPQEDYTDLLSRCRNRWARSRTQIEQEIQRRLAISTRSNNEVLHDWE